MTEEFQRLHDDWGVCRLVPQSALFLCAALFLVGCTGGGGPSAVELTSAGKAVRVLGSDAEAGACRNLGKVIGPPPYFLPGDGVNRMKNRTGAKGGNALLVTNAVIGIAEGVAYRC